MEEGVKIGRRDFLRGNWGGMTEKVRYERRVFFHYLTEAEGVENAPLYRLIEPLERICLGLGGILSASCYPTSHYQYARIGDRNVQVGITKNGLVVKKNGAAAQVEFSVSFEGQTFPYRRATVINVEKYDHKELLAALHKLYMGRLGYDRMPEPEIVECEVKSK